MSEDFDIQTRTLFHLKWQDDLKARHKENLEMILGALENPDVSIIENQEKFRELVTGYLKTMADDYDRASDDFAKDVDGRFSRAPQVMEMESEVDFIKSTPEQITEETEAQIGRKLIAMIKAGNVDQIAAIAGTVKSHANMPPRGWRARGAIYETWTAVGEETTQADVRKRHGGKDGFPAVDDTSEWRKVFKEAGIDLPKERS